MPAWAADSDKKQRNREKISESETRLPAGITK
jgi:hypothetical protein